MEIYRAVLVSAHNTKVICEPTHSLEIACYIAHRMQQKHKNSAAVRVERSDDSWHRSWKAVPTAEVFKAAQTGLQMMVSKLHIRAA